MHNPMTIIIPKPNINMHKEIEGTVIDGNMLINQTSQESYAVAEYTDKIYTVK